VLVYHYGKQTALALLGLRPGIRDGREYADGENAIENLEKEADPGRYRYGMISSSRRFEFPAKIGATKKA
jgi:hypothetical protein